MPWLFLFVSLVGAWFTWNAHVPERTRPRLSVVSFLAGWLTSELPLHHVAWQAVATLLFIWAGALEAWAGWLGLWITLVSWGGLLLLLPTARRAEEVLEHALTGALGSEYRTRISSVVDFADSTAVSTSRLVAPLWLRDSRVSVTRNVPYAHEAGIRHQLDVHRPAKRTRHAPVLFQVHGGGWVMGEKRSQALPLMKHLASRGWVCVAANYRLSPSATFPDHLVDLKRALKWIREHVAEYGGDPDFVVVTGGSAGGHLAALIALTANDPEYQPGFEEVDTSVAACVPFYGVYDFTDRYGHQPGPEMLDFLEKQVMKRKLSEDREAFEKASPMSRISETAPPFFVIHGTHDTLVTTEEARRFTQLLREKSHAPVAYAELPGAQHAFEVFHSVRTGHTVAAVDRFLAVVYSGYLAEHPDRAQPPDPSVTSLDTPT